MLKPRTYLLMHTLIVAVISSACASVTVVMQTPSCTVSSIRSDELPQREVKPSLTAFEQSLLGKK